MLLPRPLISLLACAGALAGAGPAAAATFCVGTPACPGGTAATSVQDAFDKTKAAPGPDRVELGAGSFEVGTGTQADDPIEVVGAGRDLTTLTTTKHSAVLRLGNAGSSLRDVTLHTGNALPGLDANAPVTVERVRVTGTPALSNAAALILRDGGTVRDVQVDVGLNQQHRTTGIRLVPDPERGSTEPVSIEDVQVTAQVGIEVSGVAGPVAIRNARIRGYISGLDVQSPSPSVTVDGLAVHLADHPEPGNAGAGVMVDARKGGVGLDLRNATLVSRDVGGQGLRIWQYSDAPITVNARNVVLVGSRTWAPARPGSAGPEADFETYGDGTGAVNLSLEHSAWRDGATRLHHPKLNYQFMRRGNVDLLKSPLNVADLEGGDFRPVAGSVLVDNGSPADAVGAQDGDGDGAAVRDIGAVEAAPGTNAARVAPVAIAEPCMNAVQCGAKTGLLAAVVTASGRHALRGVADRGVGGVEVAVSRKRTGRCQALAASGRWVATGRRCAPRFLRASGTARWSLRFKRPLARGRYEIVTRAFDAQGRRGTASAKRTLVIR